MYAKYRLVGADNGTVSQCTEKYTRGKINSDCEKIVSMSATQKHRMHKIAKTCNNWLICQMLAVLNCETIIWELCKDRQPKSDHSDVIWQLHKSIFEYIFEVPRVIVIIIPNAQIGQCDTKPTMIEECKNEQCKMMWLLLKKKSTTKQNSRCTEECRSLMLVTSETSC